MIRSRSAWASSGWSQCGEQAHRQRRRRRRQRLARQVEQLGALLVAMGDGLQARPGVAEVALGDSGPGGDVAAAGRAEGRQVAGEHDRGGLRGVGERPRIDDEARPPLVVPEPGRRELHERQQHAGEEHLPPLLLGHVVVPAHVLPDLGIRPRLLEPARELGGDLRLVEMRVRLAPLAHLPLPGQLRERGVVGRGGDVEGEAHDRRLHDAASAERRLQVGAGEAVEPGGQRDVRRGRVLALERRQPADRLGRGEALALEQHLPRRERGGQLRPGQRPHPLEPRSDARATAGRRRSGSGRGARRRPRRRCSPRHQGRAPGAPCARRPRTSRRP